MITYLDRILYLYPTIQRVMYWNTKKNGKPWDDPYDGIVWENTSIMKPTKTQLDAISDLDVITAKIKREADQQIQSQVLMILKTKDPTVLAGFDFYRQSNSDATLIQYLEYLQTLV